MDEHLDSILADIEQNMLSSLWRVRESCCLALSDLLKGKCLLELQVLDLIILSLSSGVPGYPVLLVTKFVLTPSLTKNL